MSTPSSRADEIARAARVFKPFERLMSPLVAGLDRIPDERPLLFVGNHTLYGVLDVPFLYLALLRQKGILLRALGDHAHFKVPVWRQLLSRVGVVDGTRENCGALMQQGECILVFPGGAREVAKRKGERYQLMWKQRMGFVRMAVQHGCTIVPFSAVGGDDAYDILLDAGEIMASPFGTLLTRLGLREDAILPLVRGIGPTPIPRPVRFYFSIGTPIRTADVAGQHADDALCAALRDQVRDAVEAGIEELRELRRADPKRGVRRRLEEIWRRS